MTRVQKLYVERKELMDEHEKLIKLSEEEDRSLDEKETARHEEIMARVDKIDADLKIYEERQKRDRDLKALQAWDGKVPADLEPPKQPEGFETLGDFLQAVQYASVPGSLPDPRLQRAVADRPPFQAATGMSETVLADGGFLVRKAWNDTILEKTYSTGQILSRVTRQPIGAGFNGMQIPAIDETSRADGSRWGGIRAYWLEEGGDKTSSKPKFRLIDMKLHKVAALVYATDELLQDKVALEGFVMSRLPLELNFKVEDAIINGTGAGQPMGILNAACLITQGKETGQAASTLVWNNIKKMWARFYGASRPNGVWFYNQDIEPQLYSMSEAVGTGGVPVYLPAGGAADRPYATLMGRPMIPVEYCATLGTAGDIILADMSQYVAIEKGGIQTASSIHVAFTSDETCFRFVYRIDGQPAWTSALTPYKGTNTQGPFVVLIARS